MKNTDLKDYIYRNTYQNASTGYVLTPSELASEMIDTLPVDVFKSSETTIFELVKEIVKKIIDIEIKENSEVVVGTVSQAIKRIREEERIIIKVNSEDFEIIKSKESEWLNSLPSVSKFQIL